MKTYTEQVYDVRTPVPSFSFIVKRDDVEVYKGVTVTLKVPYPKILDGKYVRQRVKELLVKEKLDIVGALAKAKGTITVVLNVLVLEQEREEIEVKRLNPPERYFPITKLEDMITKQVQRAAKEAFETQKKLRGHK
ncbi:MAG: hypothetical protein Q8922_15245 [Bacteroidota bacterium]|nr:hypothetical protein [Bacteroidota bacterium]MDP4234057.1 hypothetical protein [Bacteroidota bacterium]MDP4242923.1 hypothetical protein [Bacteroidota bacterium]MDP4289272.1 hypothetical protein [Bacteroidota bacterium]